jgi:chorismate-pyruvate lyase
MSATHVPIAESELARVYVARIEAHLTRLAQGHDPLGHLFGIERLARAARAEWWESEHQAVRARTGR